MVMHLIASYTLSCVFPYAFPPNFYHYRIYISICITNIYAIPYALPYFFHNNIICITICIINPYAFPYSFSKGSTSISICITTAYAFPYSFLGAFPYAIPLHMQYHILLYKCATSIIICNFLNLHYPILLLSYYALRVQ